MKPIDLSKFRKAVNKSLKITDGYHDPQTWIDTGNYALNMMISGSFFKGIPLGKVTVFAGESGCLPLTAKVTVRITPKTEISITVAELKEKWETGEYNIEIQTPDGFCSIINWFNKGVLPMVEVTTENHKTACATNHLIQRGDDTWMLAAELVAGDLVITETGIETVISVIDLPDDECFDFEVDHPNHRYYGDGISSHNSGKSYICAGNLVRSCQAEGILPVILDSEYALDEEWLKALGVDTDPTKLVRFPVSLIDECATIVNDFMDNFNEQYSSIPPEERQKVLFIIDSLGMLSTPTEVTQFNNGEMKGDMGRKAKQLKAFVTQCLKIFGPHNIGLVATNHTYKSQDMFNPDDVISGGSGFIFASSIVVAMQKLKLKEDSDGNKTSQVHGIRAKMKCVKSRYAKPFEEVEVQIPYTTGMNPFSGLFEMFEKKGVLIKEGNRYKYVATDGTEFKRFRKEFDPELYMRIMSEWSDDEAVVGVGEDIVDVDADI